MPRPLSRQAREAALEYLAERERSRWGRSMRALRLTGDPMAMANPNNAPGMHSGTLPGFGNFASAVDVQVFVPQQCSQSLPAASAGVSLHSSWTKPKGCQVVMVTLQGHGGAGGSGRKGSNITASAGGGAGAGGPFIPPFMLLASDLPDEVGVLVACGAAGGAAASANSTDGNGGGQPQIQTYFGTTVQSTTPAYPYPILSAGQGGSGSAGNAGGSSGGLGGQYDDGVVVFGGNGGGGPSGAAGSPGSSGGSSSNNVTFVSAGGGGGGGGLSSGNAHFAGGNTAMPTPSRYYFNPLAVGGTAGGGAGADGVNALLVTALGLTIPSLPATMTLPSTGYFMPGTGGCGGGSANAADAVSGGAGGNGFWGGGGGGGGAATDTTSPQSGAGGNGGDGFIVVVAW